MQRWLLLLVPAAAAIVGAAVSVKLVQAWECRRHLLPCWRHLHSAWALQDALGPAAQHCHASLGLRHSAAQHSTARIGTSVHTQERNCSVCRAMHCTADGTASSKPPVFSTQTRTSAAKLRAGLLWRALPGSRKPAVPGPNMDAGVPARPPCGLAVWLTTLLALSSLGDTGWWGWPRGEAGCTAVEMRLLLGLCSRPPPRAGRQLAPAAAGCSSAECEHSTAAGWAHSRMGQVSTGGVPRYGKALLLKQRGLSIMHRHATGHGVHRQKLGRLGQTAGSPSPSAADSADSSSRLLEGSAADPAARAPSKDTAVDIWLLAARCTAQRTGSIVATAQQHHQQQSRLRLCRLCMTPHVIHVGRSRQDLSIGCSCLVPACSPQHPRNPPLLG